MSDGRLSMSIKESLSETSAESSTAFSEVVLAAAAVELVVAAEVAVFAAAVVVASAVGLEAGLPPTAAPVVVEVPASREGGMSDSTAMPASLGKAVFTAWWAWQAANSFAEYTVVLVQSCCQCSPFSTVLESDSTVALTATAAVFTAAASIVDMMGVLVSRGGAAAVASQSEEHDDETDVGEMATVLMKLGSVRMESTGDEGSAVVSASFKVMSKLRLRLFKVDAELADVLFEDGWPAAASKEPATSSRCSPVQAEPRVKSSSLVWIASVCKDPDTPKSEVF